MEGVGVAPVKDKKLEALGYHFIELRDQKSELTEGMTAEEVKIKDRMKELGIVVYRFGDQIMTIKDGKAHVKIKTVKGDAGGESEPGDASGE